MKNKWFGDIHDFRKYGLLCFLAQFYKEISIDWMLTDHILNTKDGNKTQFADSNRQYYWAPKSSGEIQKRIWGYLHDFHAKQRERQVSCASEIFDMFSCRNIKTLKTRNEIYSDKSHLIFFDADNGFVDRKVSSPIYISVSEINSAFDKGNDILLYQHRPRKTLKELIEEKCSILSNITKNRPLVFKAGSVVYFLLWHEDLDIRTAFKKANFTDAYLSIVNW